MRSQDLHFRLSIFFLASLVLFGAASRAQEKPKSASSEPPASQAQFPAAKKQASPAALTGNLDEPDKVPVAQADKDSPEQIRKRDEWFYKQRSSVNGNIPSGARFNAFQHMQRMMAGEGKLVRQPDGNYAAAPPQAGSAVGGAWSSLGPTPTTGGFFSPVSGRIEAIAVDPSDSTGNTVLVGGAQGGIWRSSDGGATWTAVGDANASLAMGSIAFAGASSPGVVYAGTGEQAS